MDKVKMNRVKMNRVKEYNLRSGMWIDLYQQLTSGKLIKVSSRVGAQSDYISRGHCP
jgi:hypothetical protein